jgi:VWFA-related protein
MHLQAMRSFRALRGALSLSLVVLLSVLWIPVVPARAAAKIYDRSFEYGPGTTLRIENRSGRTEIEVWGEDLVHVTASKDDGRTVSASEVGLTQTRTQLAIRCAPAGGTGGMRLKVYIPRVSHIRFSSESGDVRIIGPVASATAETESGDITFEAPRSLNADVRAHSESGGVESMIRFARFDEQTPQTLNGRLGQGGGSIILRSVSGRIRVQPLRNGIVVLADQRQTGQSARPSAVASDDDDPNKPQTIRFPEPDDRPSAARRPVDIFSSQNDADGAQTSTQRGGGLGSRTRQTNDSSAISGGVGVRIIPPPTADRDRRPSSAPSNPGDAPASASDRNGGLRGRSQTAAADSVLDSLPKRDPLADDPGVTAGPDGGPRPPVLRRRGGAANGRGGQSDDPNAGGAAPRDDGGGDDSADTIKLDTKLVNLNLVASDRSGRAFTNLRAEDFVVYEDDVKQEISHFVPTSTPFNLALLLDLSGSTRDKIDSIRRSALRFVEAASPEDKISIITFTRSVHVLCRPTNDRALIRQRLNDMRATDGGTAFYEAAWFVLTDVLARFPGERNAVVVMTDGVDNEISAAYPAPSRVSFRQMIEKILESGTLVYPIYLDTEEENLQNRSGETAEVYAQARTQLQQIADASGGVLYVARQVEDLTNVYQKVIAELRTVYSLGYYPTNPARDGAWRRIKVQSKRENSVVRTRRGYYAK